MKQGQMGWETGTLPSVHKSGEIMAFAFERALFFLSLQITNFFPSRKF